MALTLHHEVRLADLRAHLVEIETTVLSDAPIAEPLVLFMPVWTPGSYLVREYARHVESLVGAQAKKVRKNAWQVDAQGDRRLAVRYRLYCNELTVRTNHVDETHALLNGAATFLAVEGHEIVPTTVKVHLPPGWRAATALNATDGGLLEAPDLDTIADSPIALGVFQEARFAVLGKQHELVVWPADRASAAEVSQLVKDTTTILESLAGLFDRTLPYDRYLVLLHLSARGRGGLEHRSCCTLLASPASFATRAAYLDLLSLIAHEALHAWNVKRIRPAGLTPYRYQEENYTRLLWWFEGATSYFDWLTLRATRLCTVEEYLEHLATEVGQLEASHGRLVHSLEDSSFDAWIKLYRPDENSANSSVSYYRKGEVVCALFDLELLGRTGGRLGLREVLLELWECFGAKGRPVPEDGMQEIFERVAGVPLGDLFDAWIRSPQAIDYGPTLARAGLKLDRLPREPSEAAAAKGALRVSLGVRTRTEGGRTVVATVARGGAAQRAGIDPGDELVAIATRRVETGSLEACLQGAAPGDVVEVTVARDGRLLERSVTLDDLRSDKAKLVARPDATAAERSLFAAWLHDAHPAWGAARRT
jgi:predicted metalloprotease with PDZ domain